MTALDSAFRLFSNSALLAVSVSIAAVLVGFLFLRRGAGGKKKNPTSAAAAAAEPGTAAAPAESNPLASTGNDKSALTSSPSSEEPIVPVTLLYATTTGKAKRLCESLAKEIFAMTVSGFRFKPVVVDLATYDTDNLEHEALAIFVISTFTGGVFPDSSRWFEDYITEAAVDFRVSKQSLSRVNFSIFGLGDSVYGKDFCRASKTLEHSLMSLGASPMCAPGQGDDSLGVHPAFDAWRLRTLPKLCELYAVAHGTSESEIDAAAGAGCGSGGGCGSGDTSSTVYKRAHSWEDQEKRDAQLARAAIPRKVRRRMDRKKKLEAELKKEAEDRRAHLAEVAASDLALSEEVAGEPDWMTEEDRINARLLTYESSDDETAGESKSSAASDMVDLEDLATAYTTAKAASAAEAKAAGEARTTDVTKMTLEMVTPSQRRALTGEGYSIIGTHSAVKLCRWTKHQLRGRGGCYKHTFYGITSYQCMEATPSLACANKCVFCWRHHKNPVGKEWRWKVDSPELIVEEAVSRHVKMINMMRGLPGLKMERWHEAFTVKHCALSLVGEPIMYPYISEMVRLLHDRDISSFLVTNAQFPEAISSLGPVTQLYVSIDAATRDTLKAVDRPLFADFWERFLCSLRALRDKGQRTVYRLTLVKAYNMTEVEQYAELVSIGQPDFIEVKAVTYSGKSDASNLTIKNSPWHTEVREFCEALTAKLGEGYGLAAEHAHSCCVLIAKRQFHIDDHWHTFIDYDRFHELVKEHYASDGERTFTTMDYIAPTPAWALYNAEEQGFDPIETRFKRNAAGVRTEIEYKSSESGCG